MPYKLSDYVVRYLAARGVSHAYELCGGMLAHLLDSFAQQSAVRLVTMHHEQGAAFAAEGHARMTGVPGVALATSGPGATNLLTAVGSCFFDSTPAVFITGQVNRNELRGDRAVRQLGFQETDIVSMARPLTKAALQVSEPASIGDVLDKAFEIATSGRPGPVLLDIPMDVQRVQVDLPDPLTRGPLQRPDGGSFATAALDALASALRAAERPLVLVGGGVRAGRAGDGCRRMLEHLGVPVVQSLMGIDVLPHDHPLRVGMIGSYGNRWANLALGECDVLLVIGSRLDIRQTGADTVDFARRTIFHVDVDEAEINNRVLSCHALVGDVGVFCQAVLDAVPPVPAREAWTEHIRLLREQWPDDQELKDLPGLNPNLFLRALGRASARAAAFAVDVGQHQMWAGQSLAVSEEQRFLTSGGMGAMGFALPAGIGAAVASSRPVVVIAGDGGFQINIQELQTVARNRLPLKIVVLNNRSLGMVRQFQESYFESRFQSTVVGYDAPDFARVAEAYGLPARRLQSEELPAGAEQDRVVSEALEWLWRDPNAPALLEVGIPMVANVYPKLAFGRPITDMEPFVKPIEMEGT